MRISIEKVAPKNQASVVTGLISYLLLTISFLSFPLHATEQPDDRLKEVQQELKKRASQLSQQQNVQKKEHLALKTIELNVSSQARALHRTRLSIQKNKAEQKQLSEEKQRLEKTKELQQKVLASQLESHFLAGRHDYLSMLLNQQEPASIERTLVYFEYLNQARVEALDAIKQTAVELSQVQQQLTEKQLQFGSLLEKQIEAQDQLKRQEKQQKTEIAALTKRINSEKERIEQLKGSEHELKRLIDESIKARRFVQLSGLKKGRLNWPAKGRVRHKFNSVRHGRIRWKGVLLDGKSGDDVRVVSNGKVLFADWVKGLGLVMVIDHGKGYMSLYGHAKTLLHQAGDEVRAGDTIALIGQSGGQIQPGLYFEMRHQGKPINPALWCK